MVDETKSEKPPLYVTADKLEGMAERFAERVEEGVERFVHRGLSVTPGLQEVPGSMAPATALGEPVAHVFGPQQAACDPIAAGIDTRAHPITRAENRAVTRTGETASGPRPSTYAEKGAEVQAPVSDGSTVPAPSDADASAAPGPSSAPADESKPNA
jgi:hypothetical protein